MKFKLPKIPHLPRFNIEPVKKILAFFVRHKIAIAVLVSFILFVTVAMWYRGYLLSKMNTTANSNNDEIFYSSKGQNSAPSIAIPSPEQNNNSVLGNTTFSNNSYAPVVFPTPFPTFAPLVTVAPLPPITTTTTSSSSNNSGNSNCTTGGGTPNSWYSDVYPNPPISTGNGSITLIVYIRDCNKNTAPVSDNLTVTLTSSDSTAKINGSSSPVNIQTQNGQASFTVSSQNNITDTFSVQDTTSNFTVTDINNHSPSVTFTNSGSGNSSSNSSCITANGIVNSWYSDVYPASPISAITGSPVTMNVHIRDCGKNDVSSDSLTISQTSSDSTLTINGSSAPVNIQVQNGQANFTVNSQNAGTDTLQIQDTTNNFTVTDANDHNPSIVFSGSSATPTPTSSPTPSPTLTPTPTPTPSITPTNTP